MSVHALERPVKATDGIGKGRGVLGDARGDPGMGELQQERPAGA